MRDTVGALRFLAGLAWKADRAGAARVVALTVVSSVFGVANALVFKFLVEGALARDTGQVLASALATGLTFALNQFVSEIATSERTTLLDRAAHRLELDVLSTAGSLPGLEHYEDSEFADTLGLLRLGMTELAAVSWTMIDILGVVLRVGAAVVLLASVHPVLIVLPLLGAPALVTARAAEASVKAAQAATATSLRRATHLHRILSERGTAPEVRIFDLEPSLGREARALWDQSSRVLVRGVARAQAVSISGSLVFTAGLVAAIAVAVWRAASGDASPGDVVMLLVLGNDIQSQAAAVAALVRRLSTVSTTLARHTWLVEYAEMQAARFGAAAPPQRLVDGIVLDGVSFTYRNASAPTLANISAWLPAGSVIAIVGENGAGKTTLIKLLMGAYEPSHGSITVEGAAVPSDVDIASLRGRMSAAFQDHVRFELLVREAIGLGDLTRIDDDEALTRAADAGDALDIVRRLPGEWGARLGARFGGIDLSGGEWQKVAISRAMMRHEPLVLFLDEPTAALDAASEHRLFETYSAAARQGAIANGSIVVLVSHRFSTVRMADLILVLERGELVEVGTHDELVRADGLYAELFEMQAASYRTEGGGERDGT